jgi:hypothetical protein
VTRTLTVSGFFSLVILINVSAGSFFVSFGNFGSSSLVSAARRDESQELDACENQLVTRFYGSGTFVHKSFLTELAVVSLSHFWHSFRAVAGYVTTIGNSGGTNSFSLVVFAFAQ